PCKVTCAMVSCLGQARKILKKNGLVGGGNALLIKWCDKSKWGGFHGSPSIVIIPLKPNGPLEVAYFYFTNCLDRKSTRLNSSHVKISYAVFCLKKKKK